MTISLSANASIAPSPPEQISFNAWKTILILSSTIVIFLYLNTAMSPALPSISQDFQISDTLASWVMTAYMVCGAVMTVIMGRLSDFVRCQKNANDNDDLFYHRNYLGTIFS